MLAVPVRIANEMVIRFQHSHPRLRMLEIKGPPAKTLTRVDFGFDVRIKHSRRVGSQRQFRPTMKENPEAWRFQQCVPATELRLREVVEARYVSHTDVAGTQVLS
jgi:hypothetical protein